MVVPFVGGLLIDLYSDHLGRNGSLKTITKFCIVLYNLLINVRLYRLFDRVLPGRDHVVMLDPTDYEDKNENGEESQLGDDHSQKSGWNDRLGLFHSARDSRWHMLRIPPGFPTRFHSFGFRCIENDDGFAI